MKEYLNTETYEYILTDAREGLEPHAKDWVSIPDGANYAYKDELNVHFTKLEIGYRDLALIWVRTTQPEALPFIDDNPQSLNDQYAEIEQVRQAIKVKSGSDSDHALDAMSFGLMCAGATKKHNHYFKDVSGLNEIDVYMVLKLFNVTDPCLQHIAKKALCAGQRGHKDFKKDLQDILDTAKRAAEINNG